jgi:hypothetical protein
MMKIKEYTIGKTRVNVHDDCIVQSAQEVNDILTRCGQIVAESQQRKNETRKEDVA